MFFDLQFLLNLFMLLSVHSNGFFLRKNNLPISIQESRILFLRVQQFHMHKRFYCIC